MKGRLFPGSSDQEFCALLERARLGDQHALGVLIDRYRPYLMQIAWEEGDTSLQAKEGDSDLVQDTCVKALRAFHQFRGQSSHEMRGWLRHILLTQLNDVREHYQTDKRNVRAEVPLQAVDTDDSRNDQLAKCGPTPSEQLVRQEEHTLLDLALQQLPAIERAIIEMRQKDGREFAEIARHLNLSEDATQKRWVRALRTLQQKVDRLHDAPSE